VSKVVAEDSRAASPQAAASAAAATGENAAEIVRLTSVIGDLKNVQQNNAVKAAAAAKAEILKPAPAIYQPSSTSIPWLRILISTVSRTGGVDYLGAVLTSISSQLPLPTTPKQNGQQEQQQQQQPVDPFGSGVVQVVIVNSNPNSNRGAHAAFETARVKFGSFPGFVFLSAGTASEKGGRRLREEEQEGGVDYTYPDDNAAMQNLHPHNLSTGATHTPPQPPTPTPTPTHLHKSWRYASGSRRDRHHLRLDAGLPPPHAHAHTAGPKNEIRTAPGRRKLLGMREVTAQTRDVTAAMRLASKALDAGGAGQLRS
jgi:hypothetical protein